MNLNLQLMPKLLFVASLFSLFVWKFAITSVNKFLDSGTISDKTWKYREPTDTPYITFCATDNKTGSGWKDDTIRTDHSENNQTYIEIYCSNSTTVSAAMNCLDEQTYNLSETIVDMSDQGQDSTQWVPHTETPEFGTDQCL